MAQDRAFAGDSEIRDLPDHDDEQPDEVKELPRIVSVSSARRQSLEVPVQPSGLQRGLSRQASAFVSSATSAYCSFNWDLRRESSMLQDARRKASLVEDKDKAADIEAEAESKAVVKCPLSLVTPGDADRALDWINVRVTDTVSKPYNSDELLRYIQFNPAAPDPSRILTSFKHLLTRLTRMTTAQPETRALLPADISVPKLMEMMERMITAWRNGDMSLNDRSLFLNFHIWDMCGYVHDIDANRAAVLLDGTAPGEFVIRRSSKSSVSPFHTVFSISARRVKEFSSYTDEEKEELFIANQAGITLPVKYQQCNGRFLLVHGVGVYNLTCTIGLHEPIVVSEATLVARTYASLLAGLNYTAPPYACVTDMLVDLANVTGVIRLNGIVKVADDAVSSVAKQAAYISIKDS